MKSRLRQMLAALACLLVLLAVMAMYLRPDFLRTLSDQLWGCF